MVEHHDCRAERKQLGAGRRALRLRVCRGRETLRGYSGWSQASIDRYKVFLGYFANANINFMGVASLIPGVTGSPTMPPRWPPAGCFATTRIGFNQAINYFKYGRTNGQSTFGRVYASGGDSSKMEESGAIRLTPMTPSRPWPCSARSPITKESISTVTTTTGFSGARSISPNSIPGSMSPTRPYYKQRWWTKDHWEQNLGYGPAAQYMPYLGNAQRPLCKMGIHAPYTAGLRRQPEAFR